jgi:hypothetical protein
MAIVATPPTARVDQRPALSGAASLSQPFARLAHAGWFAVVVVVLACPAARSQEVSGSAPGHAFVPLPVPGDLEALLRDRLQQAREQEEFERWLKKLLKDPSRLRLDDEETQEKLKKGLANPLVRGQVDALRESAERLKLDPNIAKKIEQLRPEPEPGGPDKGFKGPPPGAMPPPYPGGPASPGVPSPPAAQPANPEEQLSDWFRDRMESLEGSRLGRLLQDSPAFRQGLMQLQEAYLRHRGEGGPFRSWDVTRFTSRMHLPEWDLSGLESSWLKLRNLHLPSVPHPTFGGIGNWKIPLPEAGSAPGAGAVGNVLLWVLLVGTTGVVLWQAARRKGGGLRRGVAASRLGPWPMAPAQVATRTDLVRAFEYLSLLLLGPAARTQNHLDVAERLAGDGADKAQRQNAASELATLYELARYAPLHESLPADALAAARRDLCLLAGVAHA